MHSSGSYLRTLLERIRLNLDEPDLDAKFDNDYILRNIIAPAQVDVLARLSLTSSSKILLTYAITFTTGVYAYRLPPCVQQVLRVVVTTSDGSVIADVVPRDYLDFRGANWFLTGHGGALEIQIDQNSPLTGTIQIWYTSNGDVSPHLATGTLADISGTDRVTLAASPTLGSLDRRDNAYAGQVLRILSASPAPIEERIIERSYYTAGVWYAEVRRPFTTTSDGSVPYEIAPAGSEPLYEAIAIWGSMKLGGRGMSQARRLSLQQEYRAALKTIGDNLTDMQGRVGRTMLRNSVDDPLAFGNF